MANEMTARNQLEAVLRDPQRQGEIKAAMPFDDPKTVRAAMQQLVDFARNQDGLLAQASDKSKFDCVLGAARLGLQLNSPLHHAAAVPYKTKKGVIAQLIVEYRGLAALMRRYGGVKEIHTGVIYSNDQYEWTESDFRMSRKIGDRGEVVGAFAKLVLDDGTTQCEVMSVEELEHVRAKSRAKDNGPWVTDTLQMYRKTVLRRAGNLVDMGPKGADLMARADKTEFRYDDTATVEIVDDRPKGNAAVLASLDSVTPVTPEPGENPGLNQGGKTEARMEEVGIPPDVDPETGEVIPPEVSPGKPPAVKKAAPQPKSPSSDNLHLLEAQRLCQAHGLPVWQKLTEPRRRLIRERMKEQGIERGKEFWETVSSVLRNLTPEYYESWSEQVQLDVLLRVPKRGNPDHFTKLAEGPAKKPEEKIREEGAPPANSTLMDMMGGA